MNIKQTIKNHPRRVGGSFLALMGAAVILVIMMINSSGGGQTKMNLVSLQCFH